MTFNVIPRERTTENSDRKYSYCVIPDSNLDLGANFLLSLMSVGLHTVADACPKKNKYSVIFLPLSDENHTLLLK